MPNSRARRYAAALGRLAAADPEAAREVADYVRYLRAEAARYRHEMNAEPESGKP